MMKKITIVAFGDSITKSAEQVVEKRWVSLLADRLNRPDSEASFCVINSGAGGDTSRQGLLRIETDVIRYKPDYVIIEFGGNDATSDLDQHVSLDEFESNLDQLRIHIENDAQAQPILMTFPPMVDAWHLDYKNPFFQAMGGRDRYVEQYRDLTRKYAGKFELPLFDLDLHLRNWISVASESAYILPDGVHLTEQGNRLVADAIFLFFEKIVAVAN